jgi:hypothetical protein
MKYLGLTIVIILKPYFFVGLQLLVAPVLVETSE